MAHPPTVTMIAIPAWMQQDGVTQIIHAFDNAGSPLRFVGGAVRDTLRDVAVHDLDACTPATPDAVTTLLNDANIKTIPIGFDHGTVLAVTEDVQIEITTLRSDETTDGRHAEVAFIDDWQADAMRRDFTINALMLDPDGTLTDYVGGMADIEAQKICFIGAPAERIAEDYLRILRYVRFIATTGWEHIETEAVSACTAAIDKLSTLSAERIQQEMMKLLAAPDPRYALSLLEEMGAAPLLFYCDHLNAPHCADTHALLRLALILRTQNVAPDKIAAGWKLSKADSQLLTLLVTSESEPPLHLLQEYGAGTATLIAHRDHAETGYDLAAFNKVADAWQPIPFPISGQDIMDAGISEGSHVGEILQTLKNEWKKSDYSLTKTDLLERLQQLVANSN